MTDVIGLDSFNMFLMNYNNFVYIIMQTRSIKFMFWKNATILKAFKWADYIKYHVNTENFETSELNKFSAQLDLLHIKEIDENKSLLFEDPIYSLSLAIYTSPMLPLTSKIISSTLEELIARLGKVNALNLSTNLMNIAIQKKEILGSLSKVCNFSQDIVLYSSLILSLHEIFAIIHLLIHLLAELSDKDQLKCNEIFENLNELVKQDDYIFIIISQAVIIPYSLFLKYKMTCCNSSKLDDNSLSRDLESKIMTKFWLIVSDAIVNDISKLIILEDINMLEKLCLKNDSFNNLFKSVLQSNIHETTQGIIHFQIFLIQYYDTIFTFF